MNEHMASTGAEAVCPGIVIGILIPTYKRPEQLRKLLLALPELSGEPPLHVVVAENDVTEQAGAGVVEALQEDGYPIPVTCMVVAEKGLSTVRNALLSHGLSLPDVTHFALIDDDEWPSASWLEAMRRTASQTGSDIIGGPVVSVFAGEKPDWADFSNLFKPEEASEGVCHIVWGANNTLLSRQCLEATRDHWFDPVFNFTGGEDADFFFRLHQAGFRFAWSAEAFVYETQPPERARLKWVMMRGFRIGTSDMRIRLLRSRNRTEAALAVIKAGGGLAFHGAMLSILMIRKETRANSIFNASRAAGKFYGLFNGSYNEYS